MEELIMAKEYSKAFKESAVRYYNEHQVRNQCVCKKFRS